MHGQIANFVLIFSLWPMSCGSSRDGNNDDYLPCILNKSLKKKKMSIKISKANIELNYCDEF